MSPFKKNDVPNKTSRRFAFTFNNPTAEDLLIFARYGQRINCRSNFDFMDNEVQRQLEYGPLESEVGLPCIGLCVQLERGEEGTLHLQGNLRFIQPIRLANGRGHPLLRGRAHIEVARGTPSKAHEYCSKEDTRVTPRFFLCNCSPSHRGERTDLHRAVATLRERGINAVWDEHPLVAIRYFRGLERLGEHMSRSNESVFRRMSVTVFWGATGMGKSRRARSENPLAYWYPAPTNGQPYAYAYCGQTTVIMDDFPWTLQWSMLLRMLDGYQFYINTSGASTEWLADKIVITSNFHPDSWYPDREHSPLNRRINEVVHFTREWAQEGDSVTRQAIPGDYRVRANHDASQLSD